MPISSYVLEEKNGKGHTDHGNGKGLGHLKHQEKAMADGDYTMEIRGIDAANASTTLSQTSAPTTLADGSVLTTEVRDGSIKSSADGLVFDTNSESGGRLRLNVAFDANNQIKLGDVDELAFNFTQLAIDGGSATYSPAFRLVIDADGDLSTIGDRGELVFEYAYQNMGPVPLNVEINADLTQWNAWQRSNGANRDTIADTVSFDEWSDADGYTPAGGINFDSNSLVLSYSIGLGSGGGYGTAVVGSAQVAGVTYDFA